ncbi:MAG: glutathione S-transferase family protein [Phenylobacterium sp.]|uniref:glutathione S-transferase family protein n=1 Tax=Phenylobacterium sp. TaxID=1871053 RepID=UPI001A4A8F98|nr:glutathione S-transferase family protein [Phenylobacterium sp.]MBL8770676.1 glutathione S-transferase family protein [Phenylobacterium sp.]
MELVIGTKRWSTWSMRPWLALRRAGLPFRETLVELRQENNVSADRIRAHSPSGLVPVLKDGDLVIWDSLAICEYAAEKAPDLWPRDPAARALARAAAAEMHSGFASLRGECPMALDEPVREVALSPATGDNLRRLVAMWGDMLGRFGGPFLAGDWSIADAFYTPVATRVRTYGIRLSDYGDDGRCGQYVARLLQTPEFLEWERDALADAQRAR